MCLFVESIKLQDGQFFSLSFHQSRLQNAMSNFYPNEKIIDLVDLFRNTTYPLEGLFKCRVVYDSEVRHVEFVPYLCREIRSLRLVETDADCTPYKFADRTVYNVAFAERGECDDVLLVKDGLLTDSSYSNIALFDGENWFTPRIPLVYGTKRAHLLVRKQLVERDIRIEDLKNYQQITLFNAMIEFGEIVLPVEKIQI